MAWNVPFRCYIWLRVQRKSPWIGNVSIHSSPIDADITRWAQRPLWCLSEMARAAGAQSHESYWAFHSQREVSLLGANQSLLWVDRLFCSPGGEYSSPSAGYMNCICAPEEGPNGLAGLITGWVYIIVGWVIIMEPMWGGIAYAIMPVGVVAGKAMTDGAMVAGFQVVEGAVLGCQLVPPVSFFSPGWLQCRSFFIIPLPIPKLPTRLAREESKSFDTSLFACCPLGVRPWLSEDATVGFRMPPKMS